MLIGEVTPKLEALLYKLDFIDLNILKSLIAYDYSLALPNLITRLKKISIVNGLLIRRKIRRLKDLGIITFEEKTNPIIIEPYDNRTETINNLTELLKKRLLVYIS